MSASTLGEPFGLCVDFTGHKAVISLRGGLDRSNSPKFNAIVEAVVKRGTQFVVLDVGGLDFMDGSGLEVIAAHANQLKLSRGGLAIRSPSAMLHRILDITGLAEFVEVGGAGSTSLGTRGTSERRGADLVDSALRLVVALAAATVGGADGASVSLQRHGRLSTVAASNKTILDMDGDQYLTGEGPCVDASTEGMPFHSKSLRTEARWPSFIPKAQELGIKSILSSPLLAGDRPVGALNLYSKTAFAFSDADETLASLFASEASLVLTASGLDLIEDLLETGIHETMRTRVVIAQAQGILMEREHISADDAYTRVRQLAHMANRPMHDRAEDIVSSCGTLEPSMSHGQEGPDDA